MSTRSEKHLYRTSFINSDEAVEIVVSATVGKLMQLFVFTSRQRDVQTCLISTVQERKCCENGALIGTVSEPVAKAVSRTAGSY